MVIVVAEIGRGHVLNIFWMWVTRIYLWDVGYRESKESDITFFFFFFFLSNWSVTSNLLMGETAERTGFLGRIRCLGWDLVGSRCLLDIEEDVSGRQVDT